MFIYLSDVPAAQHRPEYGAPQICRPLAFRRTLWYNRNRLSIELVRQGGLPKMSSTRGEPSWRSGFASSRRRVSNEQVRLTFRGLLLILVLNAAISLCISVAVFFALSRAMGYGATPTTNVAGATTAPAASTGVSTTTPAAAPISSAGGGDQSIPDTYVVRSGDNLSEIAARFGVTLEALMAANGIQNPDWIAVGQKLVIPKPGESTPTATVPPVPTATETPLPFEPPTPIVTQTPTSPITVGSQTASAPTMPGAPGEGAPFAGQAIEITEIRNRGNIANEQIIFVNKGQVVDLSGWTLSDKDGNVYTFPTVVLWSGADLRLHTREGDDTPTDLFWNQPKSVWGGADEVATLKNAKGQVILTYRP